MGSSKVGEGNVGQPRRAPSTCCKIAGSQQVAAQTRIEWRCSRVISMRSIFAILLSATSFIKLGSSSPQVGYHNGFQLYSPPSDQTGPLQQIATNQSAIQQQLVASTAPSSSTTTTTSTTESIDNSSAPSCSNGLLTFELSTGFIYKPSSAETLAMMPSTLQLTDCLDYCLQNASCLAINFEMGLCVLLSSSAKQNPTNLYSSQFPVFTIYAEKKCLLSGKFCALFLCAVTERILILEQANHRAIHLNRLLTGKEQIVATNLIPFLLKKLSDQKQFPTHQSICCCCYYCCFELS